MKYIIINSSTNFEYRVDLIYEYLAAKGDEITVLASDFIHSEKKKRTEARHPYELINTITYKRNLSFRRLLSHYDFSRKAYKRIREEKADVLYLMIPQNSNAKIGKWYKKRHPDTKIVMDIVDMWPESLPIKYTDRWPFTIWADIRNKNLKYADVIVTECDYYQEKLKKWLQGKKTVTIPWLKRYRAWNSKFEDNDENKQASEQKTEKKDKISLCYLGAVNNIIDIDKICELIRKIREKLPVELRIIGIGERKEEFKRAAESAGAKVTDHGPIYDEDKKQEIMDECDFGLNIMKDTVCVGLSMKSIDYMAAGLPIINNLPGDIDKIVENYGIGFNYRNIKTINPEQVFDRIKIRKIYEEYFSAICLDKYWNFIIKY